MAKILEKEPQLIIMKGKPVAVIIDIHDYEELLERLEDTEDLAELEKLREGSLTKVILMYWSTSASPRAS